MSPTIASLLGGGERKKVQGWEGPERAVKIDERPHHINEARPRPATGETVVSTMQYIQQHTT